MYNLHSGSCNGLYREGVCGEQSPIEFVNVLLGD